MKLQFFRHDLGEKKRVFMAVTKLKNLVKFVLEGIVFVLVNNTE